MVRRAATLQPDLSRRLLAAYETIRGALSEAEFLRAASSGTVEQLLDELLSDRVQDRAFAPLRALVDRAALDGGALWAKDLPQRVSVTFDVLNPRVLDAVRALDTRVIQGLKAEVRETVRQAARAGLEAGKHPRTVARGLREVIGLAPNQEEAVRNFRRMLEAGDREALTRTLRDRRFDGTLRKAFAGDGISAKQVENMSAAYRKRYIAHNAETHARSLALDSHRLAHRMSWENAIGQGVVDRGRLIRKRISAGDDRVRPEHQRMDGEEVPFDQPYSDGSMVPGENEYGCRCIERFILLAEGRRAA